MNKRRLLKLADMLEADAKNGDGLKFDLNTVGHVELGARPGLNCYTKACAMGVAAISGAFKRAGGLSYVSDGHDLDCTIDGTKVDYLAAAMSVFEIEKFEADFLFTPSRYPFQKRQKARGEIEVARRIRGLVAGKYDDALEVYEL